eukprot:SAG31_NODE_12485_length_938_cov_1.106079_2_plen_198_part_01
MFTATTTRIPILAIPGDPTTWLYFGRERPAPSCSPLRNTGSTHECTEFVIPNILDSCPLYDTYPFGLAKLADAGSARQHQLGSEPDAQTSAVSRLVSSDNFRVLLGLLDYCDCEAAGYQNPVSCFPKGLSPGDCPSMAQSPTVSGCCDSYPDTVIANSADMAACEAMVQGTNRLQRGMNYISYVRSLRRREPVFGFFD